jgi:hypothetical protein
VKARQGVELSIAGEANIDENSILGDSAICEYLDGLLAYWGTEQHGVVDDESKFWLNTAHIALLPEIRILRL